MDSFQVSVDLVDPHASSDEMQREYGVSLVENPGSDYNAVIVAVNHAEYKKLTEADFKRMMRDGNGVLVDIKGLYRGAIEDLEYWSL